MGGVRAWARRDAGAGRGQRPRRYRLACAGRKGGGGGGAYATRTGRNRPGQESGAGLTCWAWLALPESRGRRPVSAAPAAPTLYPLPTPDSCAWGSPAAPWPAAPAATQREATRSQERALRERGSQARRCCERFARLPHAREAAASDPRCQARLPALRGPGLRTCARRPAGPHRLPPSPLHPGGNGALGQEATSTPGASSLARDWACQWALAEGRVRHADNECTPDPPCHPPGALGVSSPVGMPLPMAPGGSRAGEKGNLPDSEGLLRSSSKAWQALSTWV